MIIDVLETSSLIKTVVHYYVDVVELRAELKTTGEIHRRNTPENKTKENRWQRGRKLDGRKWFYFNRINRILKKK